ncbi:TraR/DksA family transcriptional regulator [Streptomyces sp. NPDC093510]|uniref:TraR/DksA family transcriptional regulator n=1 Tax=Streptomyces sp. NPDC093510 TaxID=3155199 RepID=UPI00343BA300
MVAKKTAVQQSASGRSTDAGAASDAEGTVQGEKAAAGKKAVGKKAAVKKAVAKKVAAKKAVAKKAVMGEPVRAAAGEHAAAGHEAAPTKKAPAKKAPAKKAPAKKALAKKAPGPVKKTAAAETAAEEAQEAGTEADSESAAKEHSTARSAAKKSAAKKTTAKKTAAGRSTDNGTAASAAEDAAEAAETTGATTVVAKKTPGTATAAEQPTAVPKARAAAAEPGELAVRPGEDPWTPEEVAEARTELQSEALRLGSEITASEDALAGLMRDSGDGAGDDEADTGTKNITREHEMSLAANAREMLEQTERALERLDAGTYGLCENCGNPIGKARMQAFPRATLCVECKQKQERRY